MDINGALNAMQPKQRRKFTAQEVYQQQTAMVDCGYLEVDKESHRKLAQFYLHRKYNQAERGLLMTGDVGSGKTLWLEKFAGCKIRNAASLVETYQDSKEVFYDILEPQLYTILPDGYWDLAIDDIGEEPTLNDFGTKLEVIAEALSVRYRVFRRHGGKTYITTNMNLESIKKRYGSRIESRLHEMATHIIFTCTDQRRSKY